MYTPQYTLGFLVGVNSAKSGTSDHWISEGLFVRPTDSCSVVSSIPLRWLLQKGRPSGALKPLIVISIYHERCGRHGPYPQLLDQTPRVVLKLGDVRLFTSRFP